MRLICLTIFLLFCHALIAGNDGNTNGARRSALGGSSILLKDHWAVDNNPALLGNLNQWGAGISYENQFNLNELSYRSAVIAHPIKQGAFGLSINQFGFSAYQEDRIGLSYGQKLGEGLSMGIQLNYLSTSINEGYGSNNAISGNVGVFAQINDEISLAAIVINPNRAKLAEFQDERYPSLIKLGVGYTFSEKVSLVSEIAKDVDADADVRFGIEYQAIEILYFRAGYSTNPALSSFGFGLLFNQFQLDIASSFDSNLGFSPQISLSYRPRAKKE